MIASFKLTKYNLATTPLGFVFVEGDILFHDARAHRGPWPLHCRGFTNILRHTTVGRTSVAEGSARRRDRYLHNTHKRTRSKAGGGNRTLNSSKRAAAYIRFTLCGHWDRHRSRGCKHEQYRWVATDIAFDCVERYLLFWRTKTDTIMNYSRTVCRVRQ
jgi:hypothetical protein